MADHVHMLIPAPPKYSVAQVMAGFLGLKLCEDYLDFREHLVPGKTGK
jgi:REP element-mobilizing transposase RayT